MSEYIPIDIQSEILKRLPVKPLLRFRSVSKPWKRLIDNPFFIAFYGANRSPQPDRYILRYDDFPTNETKYLKFIDNEDNGFVQQEFIPTVSDLIKKLDDRILVGSSHGLLCFKGYFEEYSTDAFHIAITEMVVLWNPSVRKSVGIEYPSMYDGRINYKYVYHEIGFGVCPGTFDPIVLKIDSIDLERKMDNMSAIRVPWRVAVFTLSTGTWSILSTNLPRESIGLCKGAQVGIDRFIYWVAFDMLDDEDGPSQSHFLIISFDLTTKEFKEINLPVCLSHQLCKHKTISKLRESLVLLEYHTEFGEDVLDFSLWMMTKELGVNRSFTKLYNINMLDTKERILLGFRKTGELILATQQARENGKLEIYDPNSKATDSRGIDGVYISFFLCSYMETLLLLHQVDGFIYSTSN